MKSRWEIVNGSYRVIKIMKFDLSSVTIAITSRVCACRSAFSVVNVMIKTTYREKFKSCLGIWFGVVNQLKRCGEFYA